MSDTLLILHVKGTENETTMLPKQAVRQAISAGQLTHSQLIWSPQENKWKQVRELPNLLPSQKLAPAPTPRVGTGTIPKVGTMPKVVTVPRVASGPVPRIAGTATGPTPRVQAQPTPTPQVQAATPRAQVATPRVQVAQPRVERSTGNLVVKEDHGSHPVKWLCIILAVAIVAAVGINYLLVGQPLSSRMSKTAYADVTVYGHLGAFIQPNVLVVHVFPNSHITAANLADFMVALARSTPDAPISHNAFDRVALTSGWVGTYSFSGYAWKQIGDMDKDDAAQRKEAILDQLGNASGQSLVAGSSTLSDADLQAQREQLWRQFVAQFTHS